MIDTLKRKYMNAAHAMQSGVAMKLARGSDEATPKHLRVGVNSAMVDHGALVKLLIEKGVFTEEEYFKAIALMMELEADRYREDLSEELGARVDLA